MEVVVLGEGGGDNEMRCGGVEEKALYDANLTRLLGKINVFVSLVYQILLSPLSVY